MDQAVADGFVQPAQRQLLQVADNAEELLTRLAEQVPRATATDNYSQI